MADERIGLQLDLTQAVASAKELGSVLQTTKVDATAFGAALQSLDATQIKLEAETTDFQRALDRLARETDEAAAAAMRMAAAEKKLADEALDKVTQSAIEATQAQRAMNAVLDTTHVGMTGVVGSTKNLGSAVLQTSYAVQDFTSQIGTRGLAGGLAAVQNNIPGILAGLGASGGLAGIVSIAAVSVGLLYENWDKLREAFGSTDDIGKRIQDMKDLAEATKAANDANVKLASSVKGDDETQRASAFRKALQAYGGGDKLLNEEGGTDPGHRSVVADAIAKALKGSESDIGFLKGGSQGLATAMAQPAIDADDKENERRVAARQKRREDAAKQAEKADKDAEAAQAKADDDFAKAKDNLLKGLDKVIDIGAKALEPDEKGEARRADIARQSGLGRDFKDFANDRGFAPLKSDLAAAAKMVDADMADGISEAEALQSALNALIDHVQKGTAISNRRAMQARQFQAQVDNLNPPLDEGNW